MKFRGQLSFTGGVSLRLKRCPSKIKESTAHAYVTGTILSAVAALEVSIFEVLT